MVGVKKMLHISQPLLGPEELANVTECIKTNWISSQGPFVKRFEEEFSKWIGCGYGVATTSGTTALHLALATLGLKPGQEVIVPNLTFIATANVVRYCGGRVILADVTEDYWNIDPKKVERLITPETKGIIPVHLYGHPCDMDSLMELALKHHLWIVEDCAEAHGAYYKSKMVGNFSHISCFSFYGNKVMTTGEGGMCLTNSQPYYERMRILRDHGMEPDHDRYYWYNEVGFNYRMTNLQAGVGLGQLHQLPKFLSARSEIANLYNELLPESITRPQAKEWAIPICWLYTCLLPKGVDRDSIINAMRLKGIDTRPMFVPLNELPPYLSGFKFPISHMLSQRGINLPTYVGITKKDIEKVCSALKELL